MTNQHQRRRASKRRLQIMRGLTGARFFYSVDVKEEDEAYPGRLITLQSAYFGPFPRIFVGLAEGPTTQTSCEIETLVDDFGSGVKHRRTLAYHINSSENMAFLDQVMKLDPRDRPSPRQMLQQQ